MTIALKKHRARPALLGLILAGLIVIGLAQSARPAIAQGKPRQGGAVVSLNGQWIRQGHAGFATVQGENIADVRAILQGRLYNCYRQAGRYVALLSVEPAA